MARLVAARPGRLYGFAFVHTERDRGRVREMVREAVQGLCLVGIKVHRTTPASREKVCEAAREFALPVLYDKYNAHRGQDFRPAPGVSA